MPRGLPRHGWLSLRGSEHSVPSVGAPESSREKQEGGRGAARGEAREHGAYISGDRVEILSEQRDRLVPIEKAIKRG